MTTPLRPLAAAALLLLGVASAQPAGGHLAATLLHDGAERTYALHLPDDLDEPRPLVLLLHGRTGTGAGLADYTGFDRVADELDLIVAYPDGLDGEWNYPQGVPGYPEAPDDVGFLVALVEHLAERYPVDGERVYVAGFSNGGFMAQRLACSAPDGFAAFASVAAAGYGGMPEHCAEPAPVAMLLMHGSEDTNIPWGGLVRTVGEREVTILAPVPTTFSFWAGHAGCTEVGSPRDLPERGGSPGTRVRVLGTGSCPGGGEVVLYAVIGGGHNWPGRREGVRPEVAGLVNTDIDAGREIWRFFAAHPRASDGE